MKVLVTLGGTQQGERTNTKSTAVRDFQAEAEKLAKSAIKWGWKPDVWDNDRIKTMSFYQDKFEIFGKPAFGWLFKPFIIRQAMAKVPMGTEVLWVDSSHEIISDPKVLVDWAANHKGFFIHDHANRKRNRAWTRRSAFALMDCDSERYWNAHQMQVNQLLFIKSERTWQFVEEWLRWCSDWRIMLGCDGYEELPEFRGKDLYRDHRFEQAVLSILVEKYCMEYAPFSLSAQVFNESEVLLD